MNRNILILIAAAGCAFAQPPQVRWEETPQVFAGRRAVVWLEPKGKLEGEWLSVTPDSFSMLVNGRRVTETRANIKRIGYRQRRYRGRAIGAALAVGLAVPLAYVFPPAPLLVFPLGVLAGFAFDRDFCPIEIAPATP